MISEHSGHPSETFGGCEDQGTVKGRKPLGDEGFGISGEAGNSEKTSGRSCKLLPWTFHVRMSRGEEESSASGSCTPQRPSWALYQDSLTLGDRVSLQDFACGIRLASDK